MTKKCALQGYTAFRAARLLTRKSYSLFDGDLRSVSLVGSSARMNPCPRDVDVIAVVKRDVESDLLVDLWPVVETVAKMLSLNPLVSTRTYNPPIEPRSLYLMVYSREGYLEASPVLRSMWEVEAVTLYGKTLAQTAGTPAKPTPEDLLYERHGIEWCLERALKGGWSTSIIYRGRGTPRRVWLPAKPEYKGLLIDYCLKWIRRHSATIIAEASKKREYRWEAEYVLEALAKIRGETT